MIYIATLLWQPNEQSFSFSRMYDEAWVERLYRQVARNLSRPFRFILWTDRLRTFREPIEQRPISNPKPVYGDCLEPYAATDEAPMILMGLDTMIVGNIDHLADYAYAGDTLALPRDPYHPHQACNGVALIPEGHGFVWTERKPGQGDMDRCRAVEHRLIDDLFPGHVVSFKGHVRERGLGDARIVYFHGEDKPHQLVRTVPWIKEHWR